MLSTSVRFRIQRRCIYKKSLLHKMFSNKILFSIGNIVRQCNCMTTLISEKVPKVTSSGKRERCNYDKVENIRLPSNKIKIKNSFLTKVESLSMVSNIKTSFREYTVKFVNIMRIHSLQTLSLIFVLFFFFSFGNVFVQNNNSD